MSGAERFQSIVNCSFFGGMSFLSITLSIAVPIRIYIQYSTDGGWFNYALILIGILIFAGFFFGFIKLCGQCLRHLRMASSGVRE